MMIYDDLMGFMFFFSRAGFGMGFGMGVEIKAVAFIGRFWGFWPNIWLLFIQATLWWTYKKLWKSTIYGGKTHYFYGHVTMFNSFLYVYQAG